MDAYRSMDVSEADLERALQNGVVIYILIEKKYGNAYYVGTDDCVAEHNMVKDVWSDLSMARTRRKRSDVISTLVAVKTPSRRLFDAGFDANSTKTHFALFYMSSPVCCQKFCAIWRKIWQTWSLRPPTFRQDFRHYSCDSGWVIMSLICDKMNNLSRFQRLQVSTATLRRWDFFT